MAEKATQRGSFALIMLFWVVLCSLYAYMENKQAKAAPWVSMHAARNVLAHVVLCMCMCDLVVAQLSCTRLSEY